MAFLPWGTHFRSVRSLNRARFSDSDTMLKVNMTLRHGLSRIPPCCNFSREGMVYYTGDEDHLSTGHIEYNFSLVHRFSQKACTGCLDEFVVKMFSKRGKAWVEFNLSLWDWEGPEGTHLSLLKLSVSAPTFAIICLSCAICLRHKSQGELHQVRNVQIQKYAIWLGIQSKAVPHSISACRHSFQKVASIA